jgi:hypothetical protein
MKQKNDILNNFKNELQLIFTNSIVDTGGQQYKISNKNMVEMWTDKSNTIATHFKVLKWHAI